MSKEKGIFIFMVLFIITFVVPQNADAVAYKFYKTPYTCIVYFEGGYQEKAEFEANPIVKTTSSKEIMQVRVKLNKFYGDYNGAKFYHYFLLDNIFGGTLKKRFYSKHQSKRIWINGTRRKVIKIQFLCEVNFDFLKGLGR